MRKLIDIIRCQNIKPTIWVINVSYFKDLHIVTDYIICHLEGRNINYIYIRIFNTKDSTDLSIFSLQKLFHGYSLQLIY